MSLPDAGTPSTNPPLNRTRDWGRSGEPGSAFRGLINRGQSGARGGARRGRSGGARGGRGGASRPRRGTEDHTEKDISQPAPLPTKAEASSGSNSQVDPPKPPEKTSNSPTIPSKSKPPSRKNSRNIPTLVIDPVSPVTDSTTSTTSSLSRNRRRRSQQQSKAPATAVPASGLTTDSNQNLLHPRPQRSRSGPSSPTGPSREGVPHAPTVAYNIDALVERVRAVAMSDNKRPTTPGSHMDWAGDEDDSLPDLDDWGVTTTGTSAGDFDEEISPIMVDGLKPLPDPAVKAGSPLANKMGLMAEAKTNASGSNERPNGEKDGGAKHSERHSEKSSSRFQGRKPRGTSHISRALPLKTVNDSAKTLQRDGSTSTPNNVIRSAIDKPSILVHPVPGKPLAETRPLHPSLPAKPVAASVESITERKPIDVSSHVRSTPIAQVKLPMAKAVERPNSPVEEGLAQSIHAPPSIAEERPLKAHVPSADEVAGSAGSTDDLPSVDTTDAINAPKLSESVSSPNYLTTAPQAFNPTHHRAHTTGRPPHFHQHPGLTYTSNERFSRSGVSTPRGNPHHSRTHSTPPSFNHREPITRRPVITGDAISKLARTIGSSTTSSSRFTGVSAASKE